MGAVMLGEGGQRTGPSSLQVGTALAGVHGPSWSSIRSAQPGSERAGADAGAGASAACTRKPRSLTLTGHHGAPLPTRPPVQLCRWYETHGGYSVLSFVELFDKVDGDEWKQELHRAEVGHCGHARLRLFLV